MCCRPGSIERSSRYPIRSDTVQNRVRPTGGRQINPEGLRRANLKKVYRLETWRFQAGNIKNSSRICDLDLQGGLRYRPDAMMGVFFNSGQFCCGGSTVVYALILVASANSL